MPAADELQRRRRAALWAVERRSVEIELDWLGESLRVRLADPYSGRPAGARGALALGVDVLQALPWLRRIDGLTEQN